MLPYREYVNAMIRDYFARSEPDKIEDFAPDEHGKPSVGQVNAACVCSVLERINQQDADILRTVFSDCDGPFLGAAVRTCADRMSISERYVWHVVRTVTRQVARKRGLI